MYLLSMTEMILCLLPMVPIRRRSSMEPSTDCTRTMLKRGLRESVPLHYLILMIYMEVRILNV